MRWSDVDNGELLINDNYSCRQHERQKYLTPNMSTAVTGRPAITAGRSGARSWCRNRPGADCRGRGVRVTGVMTDNGGGYRSRVFQQCCARLGLRHLYTRPSPPCTNGKAERFIQTALREWAYTRAYRTSRQRAAHLTPWLHRYHWHRPHGSLNHKPPTSRLGLSRDNLLRYHS